MNEEQAVITYPQEVTESAAWYTNFDTIMTIVIVYLFACGVVAALVARHYGRSPVLGFLSGFFFGPFGIMTNMIMGDKD